MITKQEYTQEEIAQRAKENSEMYFSTSCNITDFEEPEESYYW